MFVGFPYRQIGSATSSTFAFCFGCLDFLRGFASGLKTVADKENVHAFITQLESFSGTIKDGIMKHAVVDHPKFGKVLAYETDGYASHLFMDDAELYMNNMAGQMEWFDPSQLYTADGPANKNGVS